MNRVRLVNNASTLINNSSKSIKMLKNPQNRKLNSKYQGKEDEPKLKNNLNLNINQKLNTVKPLTQYLFD